MQSVEAIYQNSVMPLPLGDKIRLAKIIMEHVTEESAAGGRIKALELLDDIERQGLFKDADEVDKFLEAERGSWEN